MTQDEQNTDNCNNNCEANDKVIWNSIEPPFLRIVNKYVSLSFTDFHESHQPFSILLEKPVWDKSLSIFFDIVFFFPPFFMAAIGKDIKKRESPRRLFLVTDCWRSYEILEVQLE